MEITTVGLDLAKIGALAEHRGPGPHSAARARPAGLVPLERPCPTVATVPGVGLLGATATLRGLGLSRGDVCRIHAKS
jgi:hypothetical protein